MASGRIRRGARRGIAAIVLGWLAILVAAVVVAPGASAAPTATVDIKTLTPPVVSVDSGGTVTFVEEERDLHYGQSASWSFDAPATTGTITYTYRIVPQAGLAVAVVNQVV